MAKTATKTKQRTSTKTTKKSQAARGAKGCEAAADCEQAAGEMDVTIDRRRSNERRDEECESKETTAAPTLERRQKVNRRRQIDPTTCERDYTEQEVEFMNALDDYKRKSGRMFPTCSEVLEVINSLGYVKLAAGQACAGQASQGSTASAKPMLGDLQATTQIEALLVEAQQLV